MNKYITSGRVTLCLLLLQEFNITIIDKIGKENMVAYFLSRLTHDDDNVPIDDNFPDEHLFLVYVKVPWFAYVLNYLVMGKVQVHFPSHGKKKIIQQSAN